MNKLPLPTGVDAGSLRLEPLRTELERIGVPGITPIMNKAELCAVYEAALVAKSEALSRLELGHDRRVAPDETALRRAATAMAAQNDFGIPELKAINIKPVSIFDE
jgi:hypothetical protein